MSYYFQSRIRRKLYCRKGVEGGRSFSAQAESKSLSSGRFCKMKMESVIRSDVTFCTLATILKLLRLMSELQDNAWSRRDDCWGRTRGGPVRGYIPLLWDVQVQYRYSTLEHFWRIIVQIETPLTSVSVLRNLFLLALISKTII